MNRHIFPRVSLHTLCLPRQQGGLGLLNPQLQQSVLQLRWLLPALSHPLPEGHSFVLLPLIHTLRFFALSTPGPAWSLLDYRLGLVFPSLRPVALQPLSSFFSLLFKAVDRLPAVFQDVVVSPVTCLHLPLSAVIVSYTGNHVSPTLLKQPVSLLYRFDDHGRRLVPKAPSDLTMFPRLCNRFRYATRHDEVVFHSFFLKVFTPPQYASIGASPFLPAADPTLVDAQPFISALGFDSSATASSMTTRLYRRLCAPPPSALSSSRLWLRFWNLPLSAPCRNIWYRLLHQKLPTRSLLARILPSRVDSPTCCVCHLESEGILHFLFNCPYKLSVWSSIWRTYFECPFSPDSLRLAYFELVFPPVCSHINHVPASVIFSSALLAIWRHHWKLVFDNVPFRVSSVVNLANRLIHTHIGETLLSQGISPIPIVHLNTVVPLTSRQPLLDYDILWVLFLFHYCSLYLYLFLLAFP